MSSTFLLNAFIKASILIIAIAANYFISSFFNHSYTSYFARKKEFTRLKKKRSYHIFYAHVKRGVRSKNIAFVMTKEIRQIFMEKIPLMYTIIYGSLIAMIIPLLNKMGTVDEIIYIFCYFLSIAYCLVGISMNVVARDLKGGWLYRIYQLSNMEIFIGKFIAYLMYANVVVLIYTIAYSIILKQLGIVSSIWGGDSTITLILITILIPVSFLFGALMGSIIVKALKYNSDLIDYSYYGGEIIILFLTIYLVALPSSLVFLYSELYNCFIVGFIFYYVLLSILLLKKLDCFFMLKKGVKHE